MTREEILTASPEWLNEQTATAFGGWRIAEKYDNLKYIELPSSVCLLPEEWCPAEDIRDAWGLVDLMHYKNGDYLSLAYQAGVFPEISDKLGWNARFRCAGVYAVGETAQEAITKAFLLAMANEKPAEESPLFMEPATGTVAKREDGEWVKVEKKL